MKNLDFLILFNKTNSDPSQILPCTMGREVQLFSATRRPVMTALTKQLEKLLKVGATEEPLLDLDDFHPDNLENLRIFDIAESKTEAMVIVLNSMAVPLIHAKLDQRGFSFPRFSLMTDEILVINMKQRKFEVLNRQERFAQLY